MSSQVLPSSAQRVQDFLFNKGSMAQVEILSDITATARDAASALGVSVHQIGKSIVFGAAYEVVVVVVCGDQRVNVDRLARLLGKGSIEALKAVSVKARTNYVIGGVSPFALPSDVSLIIDSGLFNCSECFVAAGHPKAIVRTSGRELVALTGAAVEAVASDAPRELSLPHES